MPKGSKVRSASSIAGIEFDVVEEEDGIAEEVDTFKKPVGSNSTVVPSIIPVFPSSVSQSMDCLPFLPYFVFRSVTEIDVDDDTVGDETEGETAPSLGSYFGACRLSAERSFESNPLP